MIIIIINIIIILLIPGITLFHTKKTISKLDSAAKHTSNQYFELIQNIFGIYKDHYQNKYNKTIVKRGKSYE